MSFFVVQKDLKAIHEVKRYVKERSGSEIVWCDTWTNSGHVIGVDCYWCKVDTVLEKIWKTTKSISGFKVMAENAGCPLEEIIFFINFKKKKIGETIS